MNDYTRYGGPGWLTKTHTETHSDGNSTAWFLAGSAIGVAVALLLTPVTGRELRSAFARGFRSTLKAINHGTLQLRAHAPNVIRFSRRSNASGK